MGYLPSIVMVIMPIAVMAVIACALWQRKLLTAVASAALFFAIVGIELFLLAAFDWAVNDIHYTWGGLPQLTYDMPFYIAFTFTAVAIAIAGRRLYRRRMDRAALAPVEQTIGSRTSEVNR